MRTLLGLALCASVAVLACQGGREELPSRPDTSEAEALLGGPLIPPAPTATPTPTPTPLPPDDGVDDDFEGGGGEGASASCSDPSPPAISRVNVKIHSTQSGRVTLDATPLVGPDTEYCAAVGYTDRRSFCAVRPPGHPERQDCEALRVGDAADTGRIGPTWFAGGQPCSGRAGAPSCQNHPDNQYLLFAYGSGSYKACVAGGVCGTFSVP